MFLGEYAHNLDDKGRLTIPAKFRDQLATGVVVTRNLSSRCLVAIPMDQWERISAQVRELAALTDPAAGMLRRAIFSAAEDLKPDRQGRILISQRLRDYAGIESEVVIAGVDSHVELWKPELWDAQVLTPLQDDSLGPNPFADLGI
ncbi:MAG: division/cell wall cluster transcriptional repressor MraZ [Caldilineaceae bacterium]